MGLRYVLADQSDLLSPSITRELLDNLQSAFTECYPLFSTRDGIIDVSFANPEEMAKLNFEQRGKNKPTDVLSFPLFENPLHTTLPIHADSDLLLGTVVICPEIGEEYDSTTDELLFHGTLHLLGFDHETSLAEWLKEEHTVRTVLQERYSNYLRGIPESEEHDTI